MKAVRWVMLAAVVCALGLCTGYKAGAEFLCLFFRH